MTNLGNYLWGALCLCVCFPLGSVLSVCCLQAEATDCPRGTAPEVHSAGEGRPHITK